jgi:2-methylcitrate dehydratase PrpD
MGDTAIERLAGFCTDVGIADLPEEVVDRAKLLILDSLTCAAGASTTQRGAVALSRSQAESTSGRAHVLGREGTTSSRVAAAAHADLGNVLDADDTFLNSAHFAVTNVAPSLAEAEAGGASGREVIRAVALGFEVNARLHLSLRADPDRPDQQSTTFPTIGATASAAIAGGAPASQLAQAMAVSCWLTPAPGAARLRARTDFGSFKYAPYGPMASVAIDALGYARNGYVADLDALDDPTLARAHGGSAFDRDTLLGGLGSRWWVLETSFKPYPSFRLGHAHLDAVRQLMLEGVAADEVELVQIRLDPRAMSLPFVRQPRPSIARDHLAPARGAMNLRHSIACILNAVPSGPKWYGSKALAHEGIAAVAQRVEIAQAPAVGMDEYLRRRDPETGRLRSNLGETIIRAHGSDRVFRIEDCLGDPWNPATRWNWDLATEKLGSFCESLPRCKRLLGNARRLEDIPDARALLD